MDHVINYCVIKGQFYKEIIGKWSFSYNSFIKFHGKKIWEPHDNVISKFQSGEFSTICESNQALGVRKAHYAQYYVQKAPFC